MLLYQFQILHNGFSSKKCHESPSALIKSSLSYRNQPIDFLCKSIDWFLYNGANQLTGFYMIRTGVVLVSSVCLTNSVSTVKISTIMKSILFYSSLQK